MIKKILLGLFLLIMVPCATLQAQEPTLPDYVGYVNDFAGVLSPGVESQIAGLTQQIERKTTAQIAVVTIPSVKPLEIEQYAVRLFEKWSIGQRGKDNGILILMAVADKKIRIETGYGLEGALPDAICSQIIHQVMIPQFKKGEIEKGLLFGAAAVSELVAKEYKVEFNLNQQMPQLAAAGYGRSKGSRAARAIVYLILFILMFGVRSGLLFFWILGPRARRRGGYWYGSGTGGMGGGFGGGFGGFGGGFSGGGGASGGW